MANYIEQFLISLGFETNLPQLRQFERVITEASRLVQGESEGLAKQLLKWQTGIVGMFTAIAGATIGVADKVAMADQGFRLFSLHMYMTQDAGKRLKTTMDALGASIN